MNTIRSPKQNMRTHNKQLHERSVGGTNNMARHLYGGVDGTNTNRNFAVVVTRDVIAYVPDTTSTRAYDTIADMADHAGVSRSSCVGAIVRPVVTHTPLDASNVDIDLLIRRAERKDMSLVDYCAMIGLSL